MFKKAVIFVGAVAAFSGVAQAEAVRGQDPYSVVNALQAAGYKAILSKDATGDPKIESAASGSKYFIHFYGCTKNTDCRTITLSAGWTGTSATINSINEWNKSKRFSRGYIDKDGDPLIEFDIDLDDGGMSSALFADNLEFWEIQVAAYKKHIGI
jgi:hypothetical protein